MARPWTLCVALCCLALPWLCPLQAAGQNLLLRDLGLEELPENASVLSKWRYYEKAAKTASGVAVKMMLPQFLEASERMNISAPCLKNLLKLVAGIKGIKTWAIRFLDSSGKSFDGLMYGAFSALGSYQECVETEVRGDRGRDKGRLLFRGQYCGIDLKPALSPRPRYYTVNHVAPDLVDISRGDTIISEVAKMSSTFYAFAIRMGVCVPTGCSLDDVDQAAKIVGRALSLDVKAASCETKEGVKLTELQIVIICIYGITGLILILGTSLDAYTYYTKKTFRSIGFQVLLAFSLKRNFEKLFDTSKESADSLSCLNGVRFLSMTWIILSHTYLYSVNFRAFLDFIKIQRQALPFMVIANGTLAVDSFFCIGGLLCSYVIVQRVKIQKFKFNTKLIIIRRLWRLMPVYIYVILFMFLGNLIGSGPLWHDTVDKHIQQCEDQWWTNLIFINNFYNSHRLCLHHSWYIACDFQLFLVALLVCVLTLRWPKVGLITAAILVLACVGYSGLLTYLLELPPTMLIVNPDEQQRFEYMSMFYHKPFAHTGPYFVGFLVGYLLVVKPDLKLPGKVQALGWLLAFAASFSSLYSVYPWNSGKDFEVWESVLYASLSRTAWAAGLAWLIVCCSTGHGGVIDSILSWKAFVPLSRLTYVAYLVHPLMQIFFAGSIRSQVTAENFMLTWFFLGHLVATYGLAFAGSMLLEAPLMSVEKILMGKGATAKENGNVVSNGTSNGGPHYVRDGDGQAGIAMAEFGRPDIKPGRDNEAFTN